MYRASNPPRSILKHQPASFPTPPSQEAAGTASSCRPCAGVRFPSSPTKISTIHYTHCATSYDRRPIVVLPNSCEIPDRGCRDLTGGSASSSSSSPYTAMPQGWGKHVHPSVFGRMCAAASSDEEADRRYPSEGGDGSGFGWFSGPPALTHDDASSEESDGIASPPPESCHGGATTSSRAYYTPPSQSHLHSEPLSHPPIPDGYRASPHHHHHPSDDDQPHPSLDLSMAFLPHAPSHARKRSSEKKRSSWEAHSKRPTTATGAFGWEGQEDSLCLGGF